MTDFLEQKRSEITKRLAELKPLVDESHRLEAAVAALGGIPLVDGAQASASRPASRRRGLGRPRGSGGPKAARTSQPGRRKGSGKRGAEALTHITERPGITIPELAKRMKIKQNYLYKVLPGLEHAGSVVKHGRGWHPKESVATGT